MLFEQRERWLDELHEYVVHVKESAVCEAGFMSVPDILNEITEASADPREHRAPHQYYDWRSRARDLADAERWIGPNLRHHVGTDLDRIGSVISSSLLGTTKKGKPAVHDQNRPLVAASAAAANALLDDPKAASAAWRDLVSACRNDDHVEYPAERVKYLRDTVVALAARRRLDPGHHGPVQTAARVVSGSRDAVLHAQRMLGEPVNQPDLENIDAPSALSQAELENLAARCVEVNSTREEFVVWFRIESAFVKRGNCVQSGDVTLYQGALLAGALTDHDAVRENFDVVPEELLTEELREIQAGENPHKQPGEVWGFEWTIPSLVYARVEIHDIERHLAVSRARTLLDAVIQVNTPQPGTWKVLGGHLLLDGSDHYYYDRFSWGLKREAAHTELMYHNDHFTDDLRRVTAAGHVITADAAASLVPVLRLEQELHDTDASEPDAVVRASVRALEHCNTWTEHGRLTWYQYLREHLLDPHTVETFANATVGLAFNAVVNYRPHLRPGAPPNRELEVIRRDIHPDGLDGRIDRTRTPQHISALRRIYRDHWLSRRLGELEALFRSADALSSAFDEEYERIDARVDRLQRQRNAAMHGGTLSVPACASIAQFARRIAQTAIYNVIRATIDGLTVPDHTAERRDVYRLRTQRLMQHGDISALFLPTPPGTLGASAVAGPDKSEK